MTPQRCIECGYDFRGHQDIKRCPECGLAYDLSVIRIPLRRRGGCGEVLFVYAMLIVVPGTLLLAMLSMQGLHGEATEYVTSTGSSLLFAWGLLILFLLVRRILRGHFPHEFRLTENGIEVLRKSRATRYSWSDIRSAQPWPARFGPPCIRLILRGVVRWNVGGVFVDFGVSRPQVRMILRQMHHAMRQAKSNETGHQRGGVDTTR